MEPLREDDPERIGGHRLFALLGEGGWGSVYFARCSQSGRNMALKTIQPKWLEGDPERFRKRFAREVEAAKSVDPKVTAEVFSYDTLAPEPWFATRYIPGVTLREALDHGANPLSLRVWRVLAADLTDALRSIHSSNLVHRDLKLGNVLLDAQGASVIDFGIARHLSPEDGASLTRTGVTLRTDTFASPEQLREQQVGPPTDVFALGVVLAYTAQNRHPFGTGSSAEIVSNILNGHVSLDGLPAVVDQVVRPCLEPRPENRPTPAEIAELLSREAPRRTNDWQLPPGLRTEIHQRSRFAHDIAEPLRPRHYRNGSSPTGSPSASGLTSDPTPAEDRAAPNARLSRERDLSSAPAARADTDTTVPPAPAASEVKAPEAAGKAAPKTGDNDVDAQLRAAAGAGNLEAMRMLAARLKSAGEVDSALLWFRKAAHAGNATAAREAAQLIEKHFPDRRGQALALYRMAADAGEVFARTRLAELGVQEQARPKAAAPAKTAAKTKAAAPAKTPQKNAKTAKNGGTAAPAQMSAAEQALLREHRASAMEGQIGSVLALANWYKQKKRDKDALVWFWRAAEAGHPHGMQMTAQLLAKDRERGRESREWYFKAANAGNTAAMHWTGRVLLQEGRPADAFVHFRGAAEKGHAPSMVEVAHALEASGQLDQSLEWLTRAISKGSAVASKEAVRVRAELRRTSPPPRTEPPRKTAPNQAAPKTDTTAKSGRPDVPSLRKQAAKHEKEGRLQKALDSYAQAEQLGDVASKRDVARLCLQLCDRTDAADERRRLRKRAVRLYRKLAEKGDQPSIRALAELGVSTDAKQQAQPQAQTQLETQLQAARAGNSKAMRAVARTYLRTGSEEHVQAALAWLRQAGELNNTGAMLDGARVYEEQGQHRDALEWYCWAKDSGDTTAASHIERLRAEYPGIALVQRLSRRLRRAWS
ncbi:protein kinase [Streptomyces sp. NPDC088350]|uniref:protein kinase domain-containing protein n=1 Tax=Streptomyces sp. NPDC088350 TaxID=3365854 RepID=UPI003815EBC0